MRQAEHQSHIALDAVEVGETATAPKKTRSKRFLKASETDLESTLSDSLTQ